MNEKELLLVLMKETGINKTTLSDLAGYKSKSAVTEILNRQGMRVEILVKLLEALGCELVVRYKNKEWYMTHPSTEPKPKLDLNTLLTDDESTIQPKKSGKRIKLL